MSAGRPDTRLPIRLGAAVGAAFFLGFGGWAATAPLATAAIAPGEVVVASHRKVVQHLEGGIIREILAAEGDAVRAGQVLIRLDTTRAAADLGELSGQIDALTALEARLAAERDGLAAIAFPPTLAERAGSADIDRILDGQRRIFATRRQSLADRHAILDQRIGQLEAQIAGAEAQLESSRRQSTLIAAEIGDARGLLSKGLMPRTRVLALEREEAALEGAMGRIAAEIAAKRQAIGETRLEMEDLAGSRADEVARELRDVQTRLAELSQRARAAEDVLARNAVVAPVDGRVVDLKVFTAGGVVAPGQELLSIVPARDSLWVTARVSPRDIDVVAPGQPAQVHVTAFSQRASPAIPGRLATLSADRLTDEVTGAPYFLARIDLDTSSVDLRLSPGMPVQAMIVTGDRTLLDYLTSPLRASLISAFRED